MRESKISKLGNRDIGQEQDKIKKQEQDQIKKQEQDQIKK